MIYTINGEQPIQILTDAFSIGPSSEGYVLQISSNGYDYSDLFSVGPNITRMVTGVASGSYYRLKGNASEVDINWIKNCGGGGSGSGAQGPQGPAGSGSGGTGTQGPQGPEGTQGAEGKQGPAGGGEGGDSHILLSSPAAPAGLADGDVWAFHGTEAVPVPIDQRYSAVTKTYVAGEAITFHFWAEPWGGRAEEMAGVTEEGVVWGTWGADNNVITGPWGNGIEVSFNGSEVTFTTQNPEDTYAVWMCDFNPPITEPQEGWHTYQTVNGENKELARKEDLPESNQLLPTNGGWNEYLRMGGNGPEWINTRQVPYGGAHGDVLKVINDSDEYGWVAPDDGLVAVTALPETSKDGSVYAYANASGYGIAQAQSGTSASAWVTAEDSMTGWTQARVRYDETDAYVVIATETNTGGLGFGWNGSSWYDAQIQTQVDGEFTQEFDGGVICNCVREGDYLVLTFNMPCIATWGNRNDEFKMTTTIPHYTNAVMSDAVTKIWKGTAAEYAALSPNYDNNTFYIIL